MVREIISLLKERIGFEFFRLWHQVLLTVVEVSCVNESIYRRAFELWLNMGRVGFRMVECVSFVTMNKKDIVGFSVSGPTIE